MGAHGAPVDAARWERIQCLMGQCSSTVLQFARMDLAVSSRRLGLRLASWPLPASCEVHPTTVGKGVVGIVRLLGTRKRSGSYKGGPADVTSRGLLEVFSLPRSGL